MVDKRKVRLMTRTAMYEMHDGAKDLPKAKYYKSDYVALHMWGTAVATTIAYCLILVLIIAFRFEHIIEKLTEYNYVALGIILGFAYIIMMVTFLVIAYFVFSYRYLKAEKKIKAYRKRLHKIFLMNKAGNKGTEGDL